MEKEEASVDPLANYCGLSLFPFSSNSLPPISKPSNTEQDIHTIHTHLKSMALRSPAKLAQQAKSIVDANPQLFNSEDPISLAEEDGEFRRQLRPGLGLKRQRFSMKPTKKPSAESLLPTLDLDSLKDPEQFFLVHERLENAKREIQKQQGYTSFDSDQDNAPTRPRQRRPGLLGNRKMSTGYRHRYPREASDDVLSSQETLGSQSLDPVAEKIENGGACNTSSENEVKGSSATEDNELDELLNGMLSCNSEDLEGDGAINILQERLQIKPIALEKISVLDFPDNQVTDLKSLQRNKTKHRKALSDIDNLLKGTNNRTPLVKAVQQLASPTPPRSPFASLSALQKHISWSRQSMDPFSALEVDNVPGKNYSPAHSKEPKLNILDSGKLSNGHCANTSEISKENNSGNSSNKLIVPCIEDIIAVGNTSLAADTVRNSISTSQKSMVDNSREPRFDDADNDLTEAGVDMDIDVGGSGMGEGVMDGTEDRSNIDAHLIKDVSDVGKIRTDLDSDINCTVCTNTSEISKVDNSGRSLNKLNVPSIEDLIAVGGTRLAEDTVRHSTTSTSQKSTVDDSSEFDANIESSEPHANMDVDVGGSGLVERVADDTDDRSNVEANLSCQSEDKVENMQTFAASIPTDDTNLNMVNPFVDQSNPAGYHTNAMDKRTRRSDDDPEHCLQEKRVKSRLQRVSKDKNPSKRQSLAAAGTSWTSGLRRSTRMRTRPLEYWKGERPVYGRIHESLATVIGVKCMSPGSDGKPTMKVKSYVSDKYKELFEVASLH
ncbi:hypothetical protein Fmac_019982 [Flemingia macrophylla]|uniref:Centromere protein C n=1 Tax=Flemingia macrophylla TaxID=520843 RepID=A0ABD1M9G2_9FABA